MRAALTGGLIIALGVAASTFLAAEWRSNVLDSNSRAFDSTAADVSSALSAKLNTNIGLTRTMRARAAMGTQDGESGFLQWYQELQRGSPSPPDIVATLIEVVPASGLSAFRRQAEADPAFSSRVSSKLNVIPPGRRPLYCVTRAIIGNAGATVYPGLPDYCAPSAAGAAPSPYAGLIRTAIDTGSFIVTPFRGNGGRTLVAIGAAVYRRGAPITTVAARRAAATGIIGTTFDGAALVSSVVGNRSLTMALYHRDIGGPLHLIGRAGANAKGRPQGDTELTSLPEGWLVRMTGTASHSISATWQGLFGLAFGLLGTILAFLLYRRLSRSRQQAWGLVGQKTDELEYRALHDPLTDLPNRSLVLDRAEQILARARRLDAPVTALFMDIDGFKQVNDRFGHQAGDEVLRTVGARLRAVLRESDTVGRLGGDEFVMLVDTVGLDAGPELVAERILEVLRQPIELPSPAPPPISVTASIGIATGRPASAESLLQDADLALYKAKAVGKDGYVLFESAMQTVAQDRIHLEMDLADALDEEQLFLVYQPMLELANEKVVGVEALLRWRHPERGVIAPDSFIPIAEDSGLIVPIGLWVLQQACAQAATWHENGYRLDISVNVSARQLERLEFVEEVRAALEDSGLDAARLTLEITETVLMRKPDATAHLLGELKELGVRIAVDDFGTGYSSLAYLRQFPVDSLKIDRTFITGLTLSGEAHALTHTLIQLGKALGLQTLAEGVEQTSQVRQLQHEGCDLAQGFLFARPLAPDAVERFLDGNSGSAVRSGIERSGASTR
ncbi:MAG TPA: bifunctional diguanylate cyclase/phosphodiesterase [Solirubrobacteraceae bacterium]|nr:bifunctional diguanylate cyclase/phosphodiesterase [Solirubrobacteraceae bacterium]